MASIISQWKKGIKEIVLGKSYAKEAVDIVCNTPQYRDCESCKDLAQSPNLFSLNETFASLPNTWQMSVSNTSNPKYSSIVLKGKSDYYAVPADWTIEYRNPYGYENEYFKQIVFLNTEARSRYAAKIQDIKDRPYREGMSYLMLTFKIDFEDVFININEITNIHLVTKNENEYIFWDKEDVAPIYLRNSNEFAFFITPELYNALKEAQELAIGYRLKGTEDYLTLGNVALGLAGAFAKMEKYQADYIAGQLAKEEAYKRETLDKIVRQWNNFLQNNPLPTDNCSAPPAIYSGMNVERYNREADKWYECKNEFKNIINRYIRSIPQNDYYWGSVYYTKYNELTESLIDKCNVLYKNAVNSQEENNRRIREWNAQQAKNKSSNTINTTRRRKNNKANDGRNYADEFFEEQRRGYTPQLKPITIPARPKYPARKGWN